MNETTAKAKMKTSDLTLIAMFAAIMAICSWISIPSTIPFTLQTFGVFLAVGVLGGKRGTLSIVTYLLLGLVGVPVFANFTGGIGVLLGSTGGYIIGFVFSALLMWGFEKLFGRKLWILGIAMVLGLIVCYAFGTVWFMTVYARENGAIGLASALSWCVLPYIIPDAVKIALALALTKRMRKILKLEQA